MTIGANSDYNKIKNNIMCLYDNSLLYRSHIIDNMKYKVKQAPQKHSWLWKFTGFLASIFTYRRVGELPRYSDDPPIEPLEQLTRAVPTEDMRFRVTNKFVVEMMLTMWKGVVWRNREAKPEDDDYVAQFINDNTSRQISQEERDRLARYYQELDVETLNIRSSCYFLKDRTRLELKRLMALALFKFAYSREFDRHRMNDILFYCQVMDIPSEDIRQADFAAKRWNLDRKKESSQDDQHPIDSDDITAQEGSKDD